MRDICQYPRRARRLTLFAPKGGSGYKAPRLGDVGVGEKHAGACNWLFTIVRAASPGLAVLVSEMD